MAAGGETERGAFVNEPEFRDGRCDRPIDAVALAVKVSVLVVCGFGQRKHHAARQT